MLNLTVGTDLVEIERIEHALTEHAPRLGERLFTPREWAHCQTRAHPYASLAARFAAKEAVRKILGQWGHTGVVWLETEVTVDERGIPSIALHGAARRAAGAHRFALSLTHTQTHAQAFCVAWNPTSNA
jgi:holo-[acyl-carrier protein] synthase